MTSVPTFTAFAVPNIPLIQPGDDLSKLILAAMKRSSLTLQSGDVLVVTSKIVSKAEGQFCDLQSITPGDEALRLAAETGKDPKLVEVILRESSAVSRVAPNVLVTEHRLGFVSANAGVDRSNIGQGEHQILLLPQNPDRSAAEIRANIEDQTGCSIAVVISDTHGRPFRLGNVGVAIGISGMQALLDQRGTVDLFGRQLVATVQGYGDLVASAAHLLCGEGAEGLPVIIIRGLDYPQADGCAADLNRPPEQDLYR